ncbi:MAG TPA: antibiotic biosynthesis monooxygenase family protein [Pseudonocardiaceae bacterium]|nr:antibiotic biosynthesis monooxygenase family protein [Pseudonocardiaceae bacterium]
MPIYQTAHYRVRAEAVDKVKAAIVEFVQYIAANEPGTIRYDAWQQEEDPTRFVHLFKFADEAAATVHGNSAEVRRFEDVYTPELTEGSVVFTNYDVVATNRP